MAWIDIYGKQDDDKPRDIPATHSDSDAYLGAQDTPCDIPEMFKAEPAVLEAERVVRGRSIAHFIPDGRVLHG